MKREEIKLVAWGAVAGAVALLIVGFSTGWVVTSGSARDMAQQKSDKAVLASLTPICVAQFSKGVNGDAGKAELASLKALDYWKREDFVEAKGWATMPGSDKPVDDVARECANRLIKLAN